MIYLFHDLRTGMTKIGFTNHPEKRQRALQWQQGCGEFIWLRDGSRLEEEALHCLLASKKVFGEWFILDLWDIDAVRTATFETVKKRQRFRPGLCDHGKGPKYCVDCKNSRHEH